MGNNPGGPSEPRFTLLSQVRAYWEGLREGGALPRRDQIDPRGIAGALEQVFLVERIAPGLARFRLAGMGVSAVLGMDVRGMPLSAVIEPASRDRLGPALETVFREHAALDLWLDCDKSLGRPALQARMVLLPLVSTRGLTDLALGCLALEGDIGRVPRRFTIASVVSETLVVARAARPQPEPQTGRPPTQRSPEPPHPDPRQTDAPQPVAGFAEPRPAFTPAPQPQRPPRGKPQLRLVKSDD